MTWTYVWVTKQVLQFSYITFIRAFLVLVSIQSSLDNKLHWTIHLDGTLKGACKLHKWNPSKPRDSKQQLLFLLWSASINHSATVCVTFAPVSLQSVCSSVLRVLCGTSLLSCLSFSLGKTFMKLWTSSRIRSRFMLLMVSGRKRITLHKHWM